MERALIVARMRPESAAEVARLFGESDTTDLPAVAGTVSRTLLRFHDLYFHLTEVENSRTATLADIREHPGYLKLSRDLSAHIGAYDPDTWRSPADAMAHEFYRWEAGRGIVAPGR